MLSVTTGWRQISKYNFWRPIKRLKLYWQLWLRFLLNIRIKVKSEVRPHHSSPSKMHCHQKKVARAELFGLYLVFTMCSEQSVRSCDKMLCSVHCSAIEGYGVQSCTWQHLGTTLFYSGPVITLVISWEESRGGKGAFSRSRPLPGLTTLKNLSHARKKATNQRRPCFWGRILQRGEKKWGSGAV